MDRESRDARYEMIIGATLGLVGGIVLASGGWIRDLDWNYAAAAALGLYLVPVSYLSEEGPVRALAFGLAGIVGGAVALALFFALPVAVFGGILLVMDLPPWGEHWDRYPDTGQYVAEGVGTVIILSVIGWVFKDRAGRLAGAAVTVLAVCLVGALVAVFACGAAVVPLLPLIIPVAVWMSGRPGAAASPWAACWGPSMARRSGGS
jgi:hypothetical protein